MANYGNNRRKREDELNQARKNSNQTIPVINNTRNQNKIVVENNVTSNKASGVSSTPNPLDAHIALWKQQRVQENTEINNGNYENFNKKAYNNKGYDYGHASERDKANLKKVGTEALNEINDSVRKNRSAVTGMSTSDTKEVLKKYGFEGKELDDIADSLVTLSDSKDYANAQKNMQSYAEEHPILGTLWGMANNIFVTPAAYLADKAKDIPSLFNEEYEQKRKERKEAGTSTLLDYMGNAGDNLESGASENIDTAAGKTIYDLGTSIGEAVGSVATLGALTGGAGAETKAAALGKKALMSAGNSLTQAKRAEDRALNNGADFDKARLAGLAEAGLNTLGDVTTFGTGGTLGGKILRGAGENVASNLASDIVNNAILGDNSDYQASVKNYIAQGMSREEAENKAKIDFLTQYGISAAVGAGQNLASNIGVKNKTTADIETADTQKIPMLNGEVPETKRNIVSFDGSTTENAPKKMLAPFEYEKYNYAADDELTKKFVNKAKKTADKGLANRIEKHLNTYANGNFAEGTPERARVNEITKGITENLEQFSKTGDIEFLNNANNLIAEADNMFAGKGVTAGKAKQWDNYDENKVSDLLRNEIDGVETDTDIIAEVKNRRQRVDEINELMDKFATSQRTEADAREFFDAITRFEEKHGGMSEAETNHLMGFLEAYDKLGRNIEPDNVDVPTQTAPTPADVLNPQSLNQQINGDVDEVVSNAQANRSRAEAQFEQNAKLVEDLMNGGGMEAAEGDERISRLYDNYKRNTREDVMNDLYPVESMKYLAESEQMSLNIAADNMRDAEHYFNKYTQNSDTIQTNADVDTAYMLKTSLEKEYIKAMESGDVAAAEQIGAKLQSLQRSLREAATKSGREIQAFAKWVRQSPDGAENAAYKLLAERTESFTSKNPKTTQSLGAMAEDIVKNYDPNNAEASIRKVFDGNKKLFKDVDDKVINRLAEDIAEGRSAEQIAKTLETYKATGVTDISRETHDKIVSLYNEMQKYNVDSKEHVELETQVYSLLADEVASTSFMDKWNAWRYFAMLGNPRTHVRNILGNKVFGAVEGIRNSVAAVIEESVDRTNKAFGGEGIERTKALLTTSDKSLVEACKQDALDNSYRSLTGSKYEGFTKGGINSNKQIFKNKVLNGLVDFNTNALDAEDTSALIKKYNTSLAGYLKANDLDESVFTKVQRYDDLSAKKATSGLSASEQIELDNLKGVKDKLLKGREYAIRQAQEATFHEDNKVADALSEWSRKLNSSDSIGNRCVGKIVEGLFPFKKTPANIVKQGVKYSPLELVKVMFSDIPQAKRGQIDTSQIIEDIATSVTGTTIMGLGALLAKKGMINSSGVDDSKKVQGYQDYSLTLDIGGKRNNITIDFLAPSAMPLLVGAELYKLYESDEEKSGTDVINALLKITNPVVETSMLQGLNNTLQSIGYAANSGAGTAGDALTAALTNTGLSYFSQGIPSVIGATARTIDTTRRTAYNENTKAPMSMIERAVEQTQNKIPFLSMQNPAYVDEWGRTKENAPNMLMAAFNNFLNPAYINQINTTDRDAEIDRLNDAGFEAFADMVKKTVNKQRLTGEEYETSQRAKGTAQAEGVDMLLKNPAYINASDEQKQELLKNIYSLASKVGNQAAKEDYTTDDKAYAIYQSEGMQGAINYFVEKQELKDLNDKYGTNINYETYKKKQSEYTGGAEQYAKDKQNADKMGLTVDKYNKMKSEGVSEQEMQDYAKNNEVLKDITKDLDSTDNAHVLDALNKTQLSDKEKGAALLTKGKVSEKTQALADRYGSEAVYYQKSAQAAYDSITGEKKTKEKQDKAYSYINSLNISEAEKGDIMYATFAKTKQYQQAYDMGGGDYVYQLYNYKLEADTGVGKKSTAGDGKVSKDEAIHYIDTNGLNGVVLFDLLVSSKSKNPYY